MESLLSQLQYLKYEAFHSVCGLKPLIFKNSKSNHRKATQIIRKNFQSSEVLLQKYKTVLVKKS